jgi:hypothetical protein
VVSGECLTISRECLCGLQSVWYQWEFNWSVGGPRECLGSDYLIGINSALILAICFG